MTVTTEPSATTTRTTTARTPVPGTPPISGTARLARRPTAPRPRAAEDSRWTALVESVRDAGQYPTAREAERITRIVLSALGGQLIGEERVALARALPEEAARVIASQIPATRRLTAAEFVDSVATRIEGATPATARWDVSSVLSVLPPLLGESLTTRILMELPRGYALLFGRADLGPRR